MKLLWGILSYILLLVAALGGGGLGLFHVARQGPMYSRWILWGSIAVVAIYTVLFVSALWNGRRTQRQSEGSPVRSWRVRWRTLAVPAFVLLAILCSSFSSWMIWGESAYIGGAATFWPWLIYLFDNVCRILLLDTAETLYITISPITHSSAVLMCSVVFAYRVLLSVVLVRLVVVAVQARRRNRIPGGGRDEGVEETVTL